MDTKVKDRQKWNYKVLELITKKYAIINNNLLELIESKPELRFGQIVCNYVCPDYRSEKPSFTTETWLKTNIFPKAMDFFYEEPWETFTRLKSQNI